MLSANEMQEKISKKLPTIFIMKGNTNLRMSYIRGGAKKTGLAFVHIV